MSNDFMVIETILGYVLVSLLPSSNDTAITLSAPICFKIFTGVFTLTPPSTSILPSINLGSNNAGKLELALTILAISPE
ncbi:hypothetical protein D3C81_2244100 [compost metagenome]